MRHIWLHRSIFLSLLGLTMMISLPSPSHAGNIDTRTLIAETIDPAALKSCMVWRFPIGLCVWLTCTPFGCSIDTSLMVGHYSPDLVVTAYHRTGETPWQEMRALYGPRQKAGGQALISTMMDVPIGEGDRAEGTFHRDHKNLIFKESDAIGHPIVSINDWLTEPFELLCPSETETLFPYLLSTLDLMAWRFGIPEAAYPQALIPGLREIGTWPLNTWGAVYPRHGFVTQAEDPKAGAVVAQRAGDVVTRTGQPHVYNATTSTRPPASDWHVWWPGPLWEVDRFTGHWQRLVPKPSGGCEVFGANDTLSVASWADHQVDPAGDYAWNLWRPYKCCPRRGDRLIYHVQWVPWPP